MEGVLLTTLHPDHPEFWRIRISPEDVDNFNTASDSSVEKLCAMCNEPGKSHCSGCSQVKYCSKSCQQKDWPFHKLLCKASRNFSDSTRPPSYDILGLSSFRAILFPEDKQKPKWVWVESTGQHVSLQELYRRARSEVCEPQRPAYVENLSHKALSLRAPTHDLCMVFTHRIMCQHVSSMNRSLQQFGPPGHMHTYRGPALVIAFRREDDSLIGSIEDVGMRDFRYIVDAIHTLPYNPCVMDPDRHGHRSVPGVKINAVGDRQRFGLASDSIYEEVAVSVKMPWEGEVLHPTLLMSSNPSRMQWPSGYAFMVGLPWICRIVVSQADFCYNKHDLDEQLANPELGALHTRFLFEGQPFPFIQGGIEETVRPVEFVTYDCLGTVIILHMFGAKIEVAHIKVFNLFVRKIFGARHDRHTREKDAVDAPDDAKLSDHDFKRFNMQTFMRYWFAKQARNDVPGVDLTGVPSPYAFQSDNRLENMEAEEVMLKQLTLSAMSQARHGVI